MNADILAAATLNERIHAASGEAELEPYERQYLNAPRLRRLGFSQTKTSAKQLKEIRFRSNHPDAAMLNQTAETNGDYQLNEGTRFDLSYGCTSKNKFGDLCAVGRSSHIRR
ncbi:hypothetical protein [Bradyrhizobium sp. I1.14.4]|uniref:hypothetical protein n=1 Tax=unclassified Bradyrhizobium TaxID=2631580 RepID=UPI003D227559